MINIIKINTYSRAIVYKAKDFLGVSNENDVETIQIELDEELITENSIAILEVQYPDGTKNYIQMNRLSSTTAELEVKNSLLTQKGALKLQFNLTNENNVIFKSAIFTLKVLEAINAEAEDEEIEEYESVISELVNIVAQAENLDIDIDEDCNVTITKQDGTTKTVNAKGEKGDTYEISEEDLQAVANELAENANSTFNTNVEEKTAEFDSNAENKTTEFNSNVETQTTNTTNAISTAKEEAITEFNNNATTQMEAYNNNATTKTSEYNANVENKTTAFNSTVTNATNTATTAVENAQTNAITEFNNNVTTQTEAYNNNATAQTEAYNNNATTQTETYNNNAAAKISEYNENASSLINSREGKHSYYRYEITEDIEAESEIDIGAEYIVDSDNLIVLFCGERLIKDTHYAEAGETGTNSSIVQILTDYEYLGNYDKYFDFIIKEVWNNE